MTIFPALIDFGEVAVGSVSEPETLTFKNLGSRALRIARVLIGGHAPTSFREQHLTPRWRPAERYRSR